MKKALIILFLLVSSILCSAQKKDLYPGMYRNEISLYTNHVNWALGLRYDHRWGRWGVYTGASTGTFDKENYYQLDRETKISAGVMYGSKPDPGWWPMLTLGINYNHYTFLEGADEEFAKPATKPISIEFGTVGQIGRITTFATTDILKWQFMVGVGYCF
jgi:hypothetical protein